MEAAFEADDLLKLLTDALRRGPGSPQWQQAVQRVADPNLPDRDEYKLLIMVRERLESGKPYREVRAGQGFTRNLFSKIEAGDEPRSARRTVLPLAVALVSLVVLVGAIGVLLHWLSRSTGDMAGLSRQLFITPVRQWDFTKTMPADLDRVGSLPLEIRGDALRPDRGPPPAYPPVGAAFAKVPVDLTQSVCIEAQVNFGDGPGSAGIFAGATPPAATGLGASELSISCGAGDVIAGWSKAAAAPPRPVAPGMHTLRLKISPSTAVAEIDGQLIWSGPHDLGPSAVIGVRLTKPARGQEPGVQSLRVLGP